MRGYAALSVGLGLFRDDDGVVDEYAALTGLSLCAGVCGGALLSAGLCLLACLALGALLLLEACALLGLLLGAGGLASAFEFGLSLCERAALSFVWDLRLLGGLAA